MVMVMAADFITDSVTLEAVEKGILPFGIGGRISAEDGVRVFFRDEFLVTENESVPVRTLGRELLIDPRLLVKKIVVASG
jgi:hypothetical protein